MIVPMKKVTLIIKHSSRRQVLKTLRKLGIIHIEMSEGHSEALTVLSDKISKLEHGIYSVSEKAKKCKQCSDVPVDDALAAAERIIELEDEIKHIHAQKNALAAELARIKQWGDIDPKQLEELKDSGVSLTLYEMPLSEYKKLDESIKTLPLCKTKGSVRFVCFGQEIASLAHYKTEPPILSSINMRDEISSLEERLCETERELDSLAEYSDSMRAAVNTLSKESEFENYSVAIEKENLSDIESKPFNIAYFTGYIPTDELGALQSTAKENAWGILVQDPEEDDPVPTKLKNNRFVSLIYPMTDFLGTVPGYFEYDISGWFLGFILIFFGIIFGDGGYGLLICAAAGALIITDLRKKKPVTAAYLLVALLGGATVLWGALTCTWFGISPELLPSWLRAISIPLISNVYADVIWYPPWTGGEAGLTTTQNIQIFCFALALVQLSAAHIMSAHRNRKNPKVLGDIGSLLMLVGMFYIVLSLVVNGAVFALGNVMGILAISLIGIGFILSFVFTNYKGNIGKSVLESLKNIVSVLLGVVNIFSDIVSYIRLWAVGLAGAAISTTVNDLAGPFFGDIVFIIFAVILLVFGHGLNMILNVLSVIVHGVRLNTLEFSSHLDMTWSGHKYTPFQE